MFVTCTGIGTNEPSFFGKAAQGTKDIIQGAFGVGLSEKIIDAYQFIASNWTPDTELYIFGFSRGAYTARTLAALVCEIGVLPRDAGKGEFDIESFAFLFDAYQKRKPAQTADGKEVKLNEAEQEVEDTVQKAMREAKARHQDRTYLVEFLGVFDTVGSLGIPAGLLGLHIDRAYLGFNDTHLSDKVKHARHAMACNENRFDFDITKWTRKAGRKRPEGSTLSQMWFTGAHSDIGGGRLEMDLANITLAWMVEECQETTSLRFDVDTYFLQKGLKRTRDAETHKVWDYGTFPPHDSISQGSIPMALSRPYVRVPVLSPPDAKGELYPEYIHWSVGCQPASNISQWPEALQQAAKVKPHAELKGCEKQLYDHWNKLETVDEKMHAHDWHSTARAVLNRLVHPFS